MGDKLDLETAALQISADTKEQITLLFSSFEFSEADTVVISNHAQVISSVASLAEIAAFSQLPEQILAHKLAWQLAQSLGIYPASIDDLYRKISSGSTGKFTVPAMNMRAIAYQSARAVFSAMREHNTGAAIFELSRGEIGFTGQRPMEYATAVLCAAIAEKHIGPLFLQGDHFQVSASLYSLNPESEVNTLKALIAEAIEAGFYNIDIDASTLVDLNFESVDEQQRPNYLLTAKLLNYVRSLEPDGVTISLGGEIGEVGEENSTAEEVEAFVLGVNTHLNAGVAGLTKLSIQSGTKHGGNVLEDGRFGEMDVDFNLITKLTKACRKHEGVGGCVQHGASMLTLEKLARLPKSDCIEVHLAAAFLNAVYTHLPVTLVDLADQWATEQFGCEWKPDWSKAQFIHHARRYPIGHFKREWWNAKENHDALRKALYKQTSAYFTALDVVDTKQLVSKTIKHQPQRWQFPKKTAQQGQLTDAVTNDLAS